MTPKRQSGTGYSGLISVNAVLSVPEMPDRFGDSLFTLASCVAACGPSRNQGREREHDRVKRYEARIGTVTPPTLGRCAVPISVSAHARSVGPVEPS